MSNKNKIDSKTQALIDAAVNAAVNAAMIAGRTQASTLARDAYKATEKRLYALPVLERKVKNDKEMLEDMMTNGSSRRSKSIVRFQRSGYRVSPEEMLEALVNDLKATISTDEHEIEVMYGVLSDIESDTYYKAVIGKYMESKPDEIIAEEIPCDPSTVWRNRKRLVQRLAVLLYGAEAI